MTEAQGQAGPLELAWAWDLRLTKQLWQQAYEASEAASRARPDTPAGAEAIAEALRYRDVVRQSVSKDVPEPFRDAARVADLRRWGNTAVSLLGEAEWTLRWSESTGDAKLRTHAEEMFRLASATMAHYLETAAALTLE